MKRNKTQKGITLVALIITIIVLLILAVVAIRAVQGDGIIAHAKNARDNYNEAQIEENEKLADYLTKIEDNQPGSNIGSRTEEGVPIPKGFTQVERTTKATGLVITDNNPNGASEFVWIPVGNINEMVMCQAHPSAILNTTTLQCTECGENTKLAGKLYAARTGENFNENLTGQMYTAGSGLREPDNLFSTYDSTDKMSTWTETLYQDTFTLMAKSVAKYGGFYVGRYETSLNGSTAQSKAGEIPVDKINWYRMYENSKTYAPEGSSKSVVSEMIWGCQWDAMMKFILTTSDASHVTAKTNVGHSSSDFTSAPYETGGTNYTTVYTGTVNEGNYGDKAANIYDLEGNVCEWTQEAFNTSYRVFYGANYVGSHSPSYRHYDGFGPTDTYSGRGSRLTLYVK